MTSHFDVAVVGGGIVGLAHAWMAAEHGLRVVLFERSAAAEGATVRNFGMIWPVGQPAGERHKLALRSRELWLQLDALGVLQAERCGSIHAAHREDELAVLEEFCHGGTHDVRMLTPVEVSERTSLVNPEGLLGGMWSPSELRVDPRTASARIAKWLEESRGVSCHFRTPITRIESGRLHAADGRVWNAEQAIVCSGSELQTLFPELFRDSELRLCKLQMLRTVAQPASPPMEPHIASGLTLRHYASFEACPSLQTLKRRVGEETPELDRYGIHVMASAFSTGEVVLGDSHEYGDEITPFDKSEIDELILRELRQVIRLRDWTIRERWHGIYAKHPTWPVLEAERNPRARVFVGAGGAGMTLAFGLADDAWNRWQDTTLPPGR